MSEDFGMTDRLVMHRTPERSARYWSVNPSNRLTVANAGQLNDRTFVSCSNELSMRVLRRSHRRARALVVFRAT